MNATGSLGNDSVPLGHKLDADADADAEASAVSMGNMLVIRTRENLPKNKRGLA